MSDNDLLKTYTELFVTYDLDDNEVPPHFECSQCDRHVDDEPCPDHAPKSVPGLRLAERWSEPRHWIYAHQRDDYGFGCPMCQLNDAYRREQEAQACRHSWWWRSPVRGWFARYGGRLGILSGSGMTSGNGHDWCISLYWRGTRHYILGAARETWRCWLKGRHRRGEEVGFGFCGQCVPCPECGSEKASHLEGCAL